MDKSTAFGKSLTLLLSRRFGTFWFACLLSNIGTWAQQTAQPWLLLSLGASPFLVGLDAFALGAPAWLLTLVGGVLADRSDRRRIIVSFQSIQMLCPVLLVFLLLKGWVEPWMVIVLSLIVGITDALSMPSFQSIVPSIVERDQIASGLALNSTQFNLSRVLGPALAGILISSVGIVGCFALNAASYVPFILVAIWILPRDGSMKVSGDFDPRHPFSGVREIADIPELRRALLTVLASSTLCGPLITFSPVLVKEIFHGDVGNFNVVMGAFGVGGMLGASVLLFVSANRDRQPLSYWFAIAYGVVVMAAALCPWDWALPAILLLAGIAMTVSNTSSNSMLQVSAPARIRGQAVSLYMLAMRGGVSIGSLLTGVAVHLLGIRDALLINGILAVAVQILISRKRWEFQPLKPDN
jgi:MFS family permease